MAVYTPWAFVRTRCGGLGPSLKEFLIIIVQGFIPKGRFGPLAKGREATQTDEAGKMLAGFAKGHDGFSGKRIL